MKIITTVVSLLILGSISGFAGTFDQNRIEKESLPTNAIKLVENSSSEYLRGFASDIISEEYDRVVESLNLVPVGCKYVGGSMSSHDHSKVCSSYRDEATSDQFGSGQMIALNSNI